MMKIIASCVVALVVVLTVPTLVSCVKKDAGAQPSVQNRKWEYRCEENPMSFSREDLSALLNVWGEKGWEFAFQPKIVWVCYKRPVGK